MLDEIYAPNDAFEDWIQIFPGHARIKTDSAVYRLRFASETVQKPIERYWRPRSDLIPAGGEKPLEGLCIALDPGHLGGRWAQMEERFFQIGDSPPVREGDLVLIVAHLLEKELTRLGAEVKLVRDGPVPATHETPQTLRPRAEQLLAESSRQLSPVIDPERNESDEAVQKLSELLFYRVSEIRARAEKINHDLRRDIVLALHFNAAPWTDEEKQTLSGENHLHVLVNGAYSAVELSHDDVRYEMLHKLLSRTADEEIALAEAIAAGLARATGLVEKPAPGDAPSRLAIIGRYILQPEIFDYLARQREGAGGEIQLTDAMAATLGDLPFHGLRIDGRRFDCGTKLGFVEANVAFALERGDLGGDIQEILKSYV